MVRVPITFSPLDIMDSPSGFNQPRRKSRLRSQRSRPGDPLDPASVEETSDDDVSAEADREVLPAEDSLPVTDAAEDQLPAAFRLNKTARTIAFRRHPFTDWRWLLPLFVLWGGSLFAAYWLGAHATAPMGVATRDRYLQGKSDVVGPVNAQTLAEIDAAFDASKHNRYLDARRLFTALRDKHPEWPTVAVEAARACFNVQDDTDAQHTMSILTTNRLTPDANFVQGIHRLMLQEYDIAENAFSEAVALDPTRPDFFYFWGECLRRSGKPQGAIDKFRSALLRNRYENTEGLMQLKLWLAEILADQEAANGTNQQIDEALAQPRPTYAALFAAAGRALKAQHYDEAAGFIAKAQAVTEPAVFLVIIQDPTFLEQAARPELSGFFRPDAQPTR